MDSDKPEYVNILQDPIWSDFASCSYMYNKKEHFPTVAETASHLKLLKAFQVYKEKIVGTSGTSPAEFQVKTWQVFLSNAVRRFILFITALRKYHDIDEYYRQKLPRDQFLALIPSKNVRIERLPKYYTPKERIIYNLGEEDKIQWADKFRVWLPPLDVVIVWHSFMLNPKTFYDICMRNKFIQFANFPFPLFELNKAIDNVSFEYAPKAGQQKAYESILARFTSDENDLIYHIDNFSMYQHLVTVHCPQCHCPLVKTPWTNDENTGFGDEGFRANITTPCACLKQTYVTHDTLRKRQMFADYKSDLPMPGVFKYFSHVVSTPKLPKLDAIQVSNLLKYNLELIFSHRNRKDGGKLATFIEYIIEHQDQSLGFVICGLDRMEKDYVPPKTIRDKVPDAYNNYIDDHTPLLNFIVSILPFYLYRPSMLILRNYLTMNLIHLTIPHSFQVWEDLVGCCLRQERFVEKMNNFNWLNSPVMASGLSESIIRYSRFLSLENYRVYPMYRAVLVPTLDIDLVWHTHQLSMHYYFKQSKTDHDDKIDAGRLNDSFEFTSKLYRFRFKEDYSICFCWYCVAIRSGSINTITKIFKKSKPLREADFEKHPLYLNKVGLTHISIHNSVEMPSKAAFKRRNRLDKKCEGRELPWKEDSRFYTWGSYSYLYVIPPYYPVIPSCEGFYRYGECFTHDHLSSVGCGAAARRGCGVCGATGGGKGGIGLCGYPEV